jgi:subtilisin family serine protease
MSQEKEYIVSLHKGVDYDAFWDEIENACDKDGFVPERRVDIVNNRDGSTRSCHYALTVEEACLLRQDPRVHSVEIPPSQRDDIKIIKFAQQVGNFDKLNTDDRNVSGNFLNFGLRRCISEVNPYGTGLTASGNYTYPVDGTGVDVVIQDGGVQPDHPEWLDRNGVSRYRSINWFQAAGVLGTQSPDHDRDFDGHGTHVAGIAAGKTYGWAKGSLIYSMKILGLEGGGDQGTGIPIEQCFDLIKLWHRNKPVDPVTGVKRPTVVNMSWGFINTLGFRFINGGVYRTDPWTGNTRRPEFGMIGNEVAQGVRIFSVRVGAVDVAVEELIDEGVIVCVSAGNDFQKIDSPDGIDYNNYFIQQLPGQEPNDVFYHRGASPQADASIVVGSSDSIIHSSGVEQKSTFSNCGPRVDIYAPGSRIISATSNVSSYNSAPYYADSNFRQLNISGTSMASPQVAGVAALLLQINPKLTPTEVKNRLINSTTDSVFSTGLDNDYTDDRSISNGTPRFLYQIFNGANPFSSSNVSATAIKLRSQ